MTSSSTSVPERRHHHGQRERTLGRTGPFLVAFLTVATILSLFLLYSPNPSTIDPMSALRLESLHPQSNLDQTDHLQRNSSETPEDQNYKREKQSPDLQRDSPETPEDQNDKKALLSERESPHPTSSLPKQEAEPIKTEFAEVAQKIDEEREKKCDLFKGEWVPDQRGPSYSNSSCTTIPLSKNCFKNGRRDREFLSWRWKPEKCELQRFNPKIFLEKLRGKKLAFIGDSVARNHMESLLCRLSQEETPQDIYKDSEDRFRSWYFPNHVFTLMVLWSKYLIASEEILIDGKGTSNFNLQLDKVDDDWARHLPDIDYAIISGGHWFFRILYLHGGGKLQGCVFCNKPNVTSIDFRHALQMTFRTVFKFINDCKNCKRLVTVLRTLSSGHFEGGAWNTGGYCNRTRPITESELDWERFDWEVRNIQVKAVERARKEGKKTGKRYGVLDVTRAMMMRPDGHPGAFWGNKWMKGYNDCIHWCLPGPIDAWNDFLMAVLREDRLLS